MNRTISICLIISWIAVTIVISVVQPSILSDKNEFLKGFVNHELLSFIGVVVTITLGSAANLFIELNKLDDKAGESVFSRTKKTVKDSSYSLIWALISSIVLVVIKPLIRGGDGAIAFVNGLSLTIILFSVLVLIDLTTAAFNLDPHK